MRKLKIAVVGTGGRAGAHLNTIPKLKSIYQLVGVCDIDKARAAETAQRLLVSGYTDIDTLIEEESPDVILITVPPDGHHVITEIAAGPWRPCHYGDTDFDNPSLCGSDDRCRGTIRSQLGGRGKRLALAP